MRVICFIGQKGGTGKSTLALNLAVTAERFGERVALIDLDPQGTTASWGMTRPSPTPVLLTQTDVGSLSDTLLRLQAGGFTVMLIDTPGMDGPVSHGAMRVADLCLVPVRPSEADVRATMPTIRALSALGRPFALVVNQAPARQVVRASLTLVNDGPVLPVVIAARVDHQYAYALGQGVAEFAPEGKATAEMVELWHAVRLKMGWLGRGAEIYGDRAAGCGPQRHLGAAQPSSSGHIARNQVSAHPTASKPAHPEQIDRTASGVLAVGRRPSG